MALVIAGMVVLVILIVVLFVRINAFRVELKYLTQEVNRSRGAERRHYARKRRRLWLEFFFPFLKLKKKKDRD